MHLDVHDSYVEFLKRIETKYAIDLENTLSIQPINLKKINECIVRHYDQFEESDQIKVVKYLSQIDILLPE
ncbi:MAG TPA: hypothetical protein PKD85_11640, partial [Saprospiraceae bacterium]|nr:hypothetical protein [Saprospiraceae bacterium]